MASELLRAGYQAFNLLNFVNKEATKYDAKVLAGRNSTALALPGAVTAPSTMPIYGPVRRSRRSGRIKRVRRSRRSKRRSKRGSRVISAQKGNYINTKYKKSKYSPRHYRSELLRNTLFKGHYRSLQTNPFTFNTPAGLGSAAKTGVITLLPFVNFFWTAAGGALPIDNAVPVPTFDDASIILRGGRTEVTVAVPGVDAIRLRMFKIWVNKNAGPTIAAFTALVNVPTLWDITHFVDHQQFCKVLSSKEYILLPGSRPVAFNDFFRPRRIDLNSYVSEEETLGYVFTVSKCTNNSAAIAPVEFTVSHSISFSGDVI